MNRSTVSKCVTRVIHCRKTYAALALVGLIASLVVVVVAAAADKVAESPPPGSPPPRLPGMLTIEEEIERTREAAQRETPEESVRMLFQDLLSEFRFRRNIASTSGWDFVRRDLEREPQVAKLLDLAQNGSEAQRASLLAEVKNMCRHFIEQLPLAGEILYDADGIKLGEVVVRTGEAFSPTVSNLGGGIAFPLLLSVLDDKVETLPLLLAMQARHQEVLRKRRAEDSEGQVGVGYEKANQTYIVSTFGQIAAYACVKLLSKRAHTPALRSAVSSRQAQILADFAEFEETIPADGLRPPHYHFDEERIFQFAQDFVQATGK